MPVEVGPSADPSAADPSDVGGPGIGRAGLPPGPDAAARQRALDLVARSGGELGRLGDLAVWLAGVREAGASPPFRRIRTVLVGSPDGRDEGIGDGTSRSTSGDVDPRLAYDTVDALSGSLGAAVRRVDVATPAEAATDGAAAPVDPLRKRTGSRGAAAYAVPELTDDEFEAAYELGRFVADEEADAGTDLLVLGSDAANRDADLTAAATLCAALLGREPVAMVGTDSGAGSATGLDDRTWTFRVSATRDALRRLRASVAAREAAESAVGSVGAPSRRVPNGLVGAAVDAEPAEVARLVGGPRIAVLTGLLRQSIARRTPVLLDGAVACAAALVASRLEPDAADWWQAAGRPPEPAAQAALAELGLVPVLDLGLRLGNGAGALLAVPVLEAAADLLAVLADAPDDPAGGGIESGSGSSPDRRSHRPGTR